MLELSNVLKSTGNDILVALFQASNDVYLDVKHLNTVYANLGLDVSVTATARPVATDGAVGRYKGTFTIEYRRTKLATILSGSVTFPFPSLLPFRFDTMAAALKAQYGLVLEAVDFLIPGSNTVVTDATEFTEAHLVNGDLVLQVAELSPRFVPQTSAGTPLTIKVIDPNGGQLEYLAGTTTLPPVTILDA